MIIISGLRLCSSFFVFTGATSSNSNGTWQRNNDADYEICIVTKRHFDLVNAD